jgi:TPR repeat protein/S1-C subfamily serine protease
MKPKSLASALLLLLAVAVELPAQKPPTNATGTNAPGSVQYPPSFVPLGPAKPAASNSVPPNAFGFVPLPVQPGTTNAGSVPGLMNQTATNEFDQLRALANSGDASAQYRLGHAYYHRLDRAEAAKWYRMAADQGNADAEHELGSMYARGLGVERDEAEAAKWYRKADESYRKAAGNGDAEAQTKLGDAYQYGWIGLATNFAEAVNWYRKAAEQGNAVAQSRLGHAYWHGELGLATNFAEAVNWYRKAAEQGNANAQESLGLLHLDAVPEDRAEGLKWLRKAAENGDEFAQFFLGALYDDGRLVTKDEAEAAKWYRMAADKGNRFAQDRLGDMYSNGEGVARNRAEAVKWWRNAAEQGDADAQYSLARDYSSDLMEAERKGPKTNVTVAINERVKWLRKAAEQGHLMAQMELAHILRQGSDFLLITNEIEKNPTEAAKWYLRAAQQGNASSQSSIGDMFSKGEGVLKDYAEAEKWYRRAAEQGDQDAQWSLGFMFYQGEGVPQDFVEAYKWYNIASANFSDPFSALQKNIGEIRDKIAKQMTPQQIAEGQRLSREFVARKEGGASDRGDDKVSAAAAASPRFSGTGFFITDDGYLISNYHVVKEAVKVRLLTGAGFIDAKVVKVDAANDLALLKAAGRFAALPVAASRGVKLGGTVATVGFPDTGLQGFSPKLAKGEIASLAGSQDDARYFQISVPVQPGNSGGALVDARGNVVGIVAATLDARAALEATGSLPQNVNYAVKSSFLLGFLESVPDVSAKLKEQNTQDEKFEDVVKSAQQAAVLVLVY